MENARRITEEQKVVLDKIKHVHRFFEGLEVVCSAIEDVRPHLSYDFKKLDGSRSFTLSSKLPPQGSFRYTR